MPTKTSKTLDKGKGVAAAASSELPPELDFFKYAPGGSGSIKRKEDTEKDDTPRKKPRVVDDVHEHADDSSQPSTSMPRQRVTAKGSDVPEAIESFEELSTRYDVAPRLLANLAESGYNHPTGIQAHGIPILLEV